MADYGNDIITLTDEEGNELNFEILASVEVDGETYVGMIELFDDPQRMLESDGQLVIMKQVEDNSGDVVLITLDSNEELARVVAEFEKVLDEEYIIDDTEN
ncbi:MAG: DUF1292 domain-containing protein [Clostridia bacterium]|nr:DUF1292 domain-containing protein [Clostridia bacterium]